MKATCFTGGARTSVHLRYSVPQGKALTYAYSELTVPETLGPLGTFYMANGFGEGYFGMQVNGPSERRVLFSIWAPSERIIRGKSLQINA